jgi:putative Mg2+ transporter-C (MgtC) family protein
LAIISLNLILAQAASSELLATLRVDLLLKLVLAVLLGGAVGLERQIAGKPAGLRTNILICVGSALLMDLSANLAGPNGVLGDPARLAAQVVSGIGFIGAGTIMQSRGTVTGLTSAATIWVVAAMGLTIGAGYYIEALGTGVLVTLVLAGLGNVEHRLLRIRRESSATIRVKPGTPFEDIEAVLRAGGLKVRTRETFDHPDDRVFEVRLAGPARQFDVVRESLARRKDVLDLMFP